MNSSQMDTPGRSILIVDDNPANLHLLSQMLAVRGYQVRAATSGVRALASAWTDPPDLILLDIKMPEMDGYEVCERLKADERTYDVPIIFVSALNGMEDKVQAFAMGGVDYVTKPFQLDEVLARVETHLALRSMQKRLQEQNAQLRQEIAERKRAEEASVRAKEEWERTFEIVPDLIAIIDKQYRITRVNNAMAERLGLTPDECVGQICYRVVHGVDKPPSFCPHVRLLKDRREHTEEIHEERLGGDFIVSVSPLFDRKGTLTGSVHVARDITARKQAEEALRQYTVDLETQNAELDAFAHTVAHDLKNPLTAVIGIADVLKEDYAAILDNGLQEYLHTITRSGHRMENIIEELLLLAGVRKMEAEMEPLDMASIVAKAQERLAYLIEEHQAEIILPAVWPVALGYGPWVEEVWANYLSNAIKYGGRPPRAELGADPLSIPADEGEIKGEMIRFWVRDNGPGIMPEDQARLFIPFTQLSQVRARGHGLGLSIVQRIVEKLNGEVGVESQVGRGSVFSFTLPAVGNQAGVDMTGGQE